MDIILILEIILVFAALMFFHELGHFLLAKRAGIFVREFSLGLGPKLFSFKKGETQYSLRILPFGAYVRMAGEDPEVSEFANGQTIGIDVNAQGQVSNIYANKEANHLLVDIEEIDLEHELVLKGTDMDGNPVKFPVSREAIIYDEKSKKTQIAPWDRQFGSKSIIDRFAAILAGPVFNIILAIVLFFASTMMLGVPSNSLMLGEINNNSPAQKAGLQKGDIILGVDNMELESYEEILAAIQSSPGKEINLMVQRDNTNIVVPVTPEDSGGKGLIGVQILQVWEDATFTQAASYSITKTAEMTTMIFDGFKMIVTGKVTMDDLAGPVGIIDITSTAAKEGLAVLLNWSALLSLYLGIFNLLPIPALDGSRLLFLTFEAVRGKPVDPHKESMVHLIGFAFLMLLMIVVTVNDVTRIFN